LQAQYLGRDVGALGRQQKAQGALQLGLGTRVDMQQLHGAAAADLLGQRAGKALEGALHAAGLRIVQRLGCAAEHYHMRAAAKILQGWLEELA